MIIQQSLSEQFPYDSLVVVSPHPDDSCIAVGGFLARLAQEKPSCRVHVLIMTSGYRGVSDPYLGRFLKQQGAHPGFADEKRQRGLSLLEKKQTQGLDLQERHELMEMKTAVRQQEVQNESRILSFTPHHLNLELYDEHAIAQGDRQRLRQALEPLSKIGKKRLVVHPGIYDTHYTHRLCSQLVREVLSAHFPMLYDCWAYESLWTQIQARPDIIISLSEKAFEKKLEATSAHPSQTDRTPYGELVQGLAVRNAALMSETLGSFDINRAYRLGKYVELLTKQGDRILYT